MICPTPATAIAWQVWARNRMGFGAIAVLLLVGASLVHWLGGLPNRHGAAEAIASTATGLILLATIHAFHFTEGSKKGGFGAFPQRLFVLPVSTGWLTAWPMIYGSLAVVSVYGMCALLLWRPLDRELPILWPSLYLIFALTQFQWILWSCARFRYLKLFLLCLSASLVLFGWMFFLPGIYQGTLDSWGYTGDPKKVLDGLLAALLAAAPVTYGLSVLALRRQRHVGSPVRFRWIASPRFLKAVPRQSRGIPFRSPARALFWQEWRRTGFILPLGVLTVMALTCIPSAIANGPSARATFGLLVWLLAAPLLLAAVLGRGFGKPDFWSPALDMTAFQAILPIATGPRIAAKLKVAFFSAGITWALVLYIGFLWTTLAGDFSDVLAWWHRYRLMNAISHPWLFFNLVVPTLILLTWRLLISGLPAGMSGRRLVFYIGNLMVGLMFISLFLVILFGAGESGWTLGLDELWPWVQRLPWLLSGLIVAKLWMAILAWSRAVRAAQVSRRIVCQYGAFWLIAVGLCGGCLSMVAGAAPWWRHVMLMAAILMIPLASPALAMLTLADNRSRP